MDTETAKSDSLWTESGDDEDAVMMLPRDIQRSSHTFLVIVYVPYGHGCFFKADPPHLSTSVEKGSREIGTGE